MNRKHLLSFFLCMALLLNSIPAVATDQGTPGRVIKGSCEESNEGKSNYFKTKFQTDSNNNGKYDTELIHHCDGTKETRKIKEKSFVLPSASDVQRDDCSDFVLFENGYDHYFMELSYESDIVGFEYTNDNLDEDGIKTVYLIPVNDPIYMNQYADEYENESIESSILYEDVTTGKVVSELRVVGNEQVIGIEYKASLNTDPIIVYILPLNT